MQVRRAEQLRQKRCNESGGVEKRWKAGGNHTTTNRRSTKTSTTFCVFPLTENFLPLILRFQIQGAWKRQTDRVGEWIKVRVSPRSGPGSKRKNRARSTCSAPVFEAEHLLLG